MADLVHLPVVLVVTTDYVTSIFRGTRLEPVPSGSRCFGTEVLVALQDEDVPACASVLRTYESRFLAARTVSDALEPFYWTQRI